MSRVPARPRTEMNFLQLLRQYSDAIDAADDPSSVEKPEGLDTCYHQLKQAMEYDGGGEIEYVEIGFGDSAYAVNLSTREVYMMTSLVVGDDDASWHPITEDPNHFHGIFYNFEDQERVDFEVNGTGVRLEPSAEAAAGWGGAAHGGAAGADGEDGAISTSGAVREFVAAHRHSEGDVAPVTDFFFDFDDTIALHTIGTDRYRKFFFGEETGLQTNPSDNGSFASARATKYLQETAPTLEGYNEMLRSIIPHPDEVLAMFAQIKDQGGHVKIASRNNAHLIAAALKAHGLDQYVEVIIGGNGTLRSDDGFKDIDNRVVVDIRGYKASAILAETTEHGHAMLIDDSNLIRQCQENGIEFLQVPERGAGIVGTDDFYDKALVKAIAARNSALDFARGDVEPGHGAAGHGVAGAAAAAAGAAHPSRSRGGAAEESPQPTLVRCLSALATKPNGVGRKSFAGLEAEKIKKIGVFDIGGNNFTISVLHDRYGRKLIILKNNEGISFAIDEKGTPQSATGDKESQSKALIGQANEITLTEQQINDIFNAFNRVAAPAAAGHGAAGAAAGAAGAAGSAAGAAGGAVDVNTPAGAAASGRQPRRANPVVNGAAGMGAASADPQPQIYSISFIMSKVVDKFMETGEITKPKKDTLIVSYNSSTEGTTQLQFFITPGGHIEARSPDGMGPSAILDPDNLDKGFVGDPSLAQWLNKNMHETEKAENIYNTILKKFQDAQNKIIAAELDAAGHGAAAPPRGAAAKPAVKPVTSEEVQERIEYARGEEDAITYRLAKRLAQAKKEAAKARAIESEGDAGIKGFARAESDTYAMASKSLNEVEIDISAEGFPPKPENGIRLSVSLVDAQDDSGEKIVVVQYHANGDKGDVGKENKRAELAYIQAVIRHIKDTRTRDNITDFVIVGDFNRHAYEPEKDGDGYYKPDPSLLNDVALPIQHVATSQPVSKTRGDTTKETPRLNAFLNNQILKNQLQDTSSTMWVMAGNFGTARSSDEELIGQFDKHDQILAVDSAPELQGCDHAPSTLKYRGIKFVTTGHMPVTGKKAPHQMEEVFDLAKVDEYVTAKGIPGDDPQAKRLEAKLRLENAATLKLYDLLLANLTEEQRAALKDQYLTDDGHLDPNKVNAMKGGDLETLLKALDKAVTTDGKAGTKGGVIKDSVDKVLDDWIASTEYKALIDLTHPEIQGQLRDVETYKKGVQGSKYNPARAIIEATSKLKNKEGKEVGFQLAGGYMPKLFGVSFPTAAAISQMQNESTIHHIDGDDPVMLVSTEAGEGSKDRKAYDDLREKMRERFTLKEKREDGQDMDSKTVHDLEIERIDAELRMYQTSRQVVDAALDETVDLTDVIQLGFARYIVANYGISNGEEDETRELRGAPAGEGDPMYAAFHYSEVEAQVEIEGYRIVKELTQKKIGEGNLVPHIKIFQGDKELAAFTIDNDGNVKQISGEVLDDKFEKEAAQDAANKFSARLSTSLQEQHEKDLMAAATIQAAWRGHREKKNRRAEADSLETVVGVETADASVGTEVDGPDPAARKRRPLPTLGGDGRGAAARRGGPRVRFADGGGDGRRLPSTPPRSTPNPLVPNPDEGTCTLESVIVEAFNRFHDTNVGAANGNKAELDELYFILQGAFMPEFVKLLGGKVLIKKDDTPRADLDEVATYKIEIETSDGKRSTLSIQYQRTEDRPAEYQNNIASGDEIEIGESLANKLVEEAQEALQAAYNARAEERHKAATVFQAYERGRVQKGKYEKMLAEKEAAADGDAHPDPTPPAPPRPATPTPITKTEFEADRDNIFAHAYALMTIDRINGVSPSTATFRDYIKSYLRQQGRTLPRDFTIDIDVNLDLTEVSNKIKGMDHNALIDQYDAIRRSDLKSNTLGRAQTHFNNLTSPIDIKQLIGIYPGGVIDGKDGKTNNYYLNFTNFNFHGIDFRFDRDNMFHTAFRNCGFDEACSFNGREKFNSRFQECKEIEGVIRTALLGQGKTDREGIITVKTKKSITRDAAITPGMTDKERRAQRDKLYKYSVSQAIGDESYQKEGVATQYTGEKVRDSAEYKDINAKSLDVDQMIKDGRLRKIGVKWTKVDLGVGLDSPIPDPASASLGGDDPRGSVHGGGAAGRFGGRGFVDPRGGVHGGGGAAGGGIGRVSVDPSDPTSVPSPAHPMSVPAGGDKPRSASLGGDDPRGSVHGGGGAAGRGDIPTSPRFAARKAELEAEAAARRERSSAAVAELRRRVEEFKAAKEAIVHEAEATEASLGDLRRNTAELEAERAAAAERTAEQEAKLDRAEAARAAGHGGVSTTIRGARSADATGAAPHPTVRNPTATGLSTRADRTPSELAAGKRAFTTGMVLDG